MATLHDDVDLLCLSRAKIELPYRYLYRRSHVFVDIMNLPSTIFANTQKVLPLLLSL
jgi:hypothetical protein